MYPLTQWPVTRLCVCMCHRLHWQCIKCVWECVFERAPCSDWTDPNPLRLAGDKINRSRTKGKPWWGSCCQNTAWRYGRLPPSRPSIHPSIQLPVHLLSVHSLLLSLILNDAMRSFTESLGSTRRPIGWQIFSVDGLKSSMLKKIPTWTSELEERNLSFAQSNQCFP